MDLPLERSKELVPDKGMQWVEYLNSQGISAEAFYKLVGLGQNEMKELIRKDLAREKTAK